MAYQTLQLTQDGAVTTVWLNRPEVRNAFNEAAIAEITEVFEKLDATQDVRAVVLAAHGVSFCAGADLNWMRKMAGYSREENLADAAQLARMLKTIHRCRRPVVARVQGDCYAGGMGLAAACDIVVAAEGVNFCLSEVRLGLIPATISPYVIRAIGESAARRYFLTAERIPAQEAYRIGLAHEVVPADRLDATVGGILKSLLAASPNAVSEAKRLVRDVAGAKLDDALIDDTVTRIADIRASQEGREGVQSFLEKRRPNWIDREV
ncbi:enoyl-CoA hydratase/isomerase family protein [Noviherbaspirillum pedocola]|uniref:Enoyl-CoA hydratase/isomerase family protein n=1 Tax=Noviherbaspirillum pedocola TaxID=2801341 RepID=A0A934SYZ1_9BURK|nr:enoyl-CoA hydratase/isomerase family protein [Noviherbaspirillum pedocola]MBK4738292.1 enoyl-CoA hydratase/isomerase family protein [Noviherbaspirillum pedocola]